MTEPITPERLAGAIKRRLWLASPTLQNKATVKEVDRIAYSLGDLFADQTAEVDRLRAQTCGAYRRDYPSVIPCMLPPHDDRAPHWSTSGCAGGAVQWFSQELDHWPNRLPPRGLPERNPDSHEWLGSDR